MNNAQRVCLNFVALLLIAFVSGCEGKKPLTVSEVIQKAKALEGKNIRVRGLAFLWVEPSREEIWTFGGCAPPSAGGSSSQEHVVGWLTLYDQIDPTDLKNYGSPHDRIGIKISENSFHCEGDYCGTTCSPFEAVSQRTCEFAGRLHVNEEAGLVLTDIDLVRSSQLVDEKWGSIPTGKFDFWLP